MPKLPLNLLKNLKKPAKNEGPPPVKFEGTYEKTDFKKFFKHKKYIPYWILIAILLTITVLLIVYHKNIVDWLEPISAKIRALKWGWIIPIIILIVLSFPPLFGHEIIAVLCGVVYGLWRGFAIVAAGTFLGEIATYFTFKYFLRKRAEKAERTNLNYACLSTITREGGFLFVFIVRLSAIPPHFTTAVFATCGVSFLIFAIATLASLPKQLVTVYLGVIIENPGGSKKASNILLALTFTVTVLAAVYIVRQMRKARPRLLAHAQSTRETDQAFSAEFDGTEYNSGAGGYTALGETEPVIKPDRTIAMMAPPSTSTLNSPRYEPMRDDGRRLNYDGSYEESSDGGTPRLSRAVQPPYPTSETSYPMGGLYSPSIGTDSNLPTPTYTRDMV